MTFYWSYSGREKVESGTRIKPVLFHSRGHSPFIQSSVTVPENTKVKVLGVSHVQLCHPMDRGPPGSSVHGIVQARILEWVTIPFSKGSSQLRERTQVSCLVGGFFTVWALFSNTTTTTTTKSLQSCPTLCNPMDCSLPGFSIHGILQARTLEWGAISFSSAWKWKVKVKSLSRVRLLTTPWTAAHQAPPSMGFSRQQYWSGVPLPSPFSNKGFNKELLDKYCPLVAQKCYRLSGLSPKLLKLYNTILCSKNF